MNKKMGRYQNCILPLLIMGISALLMGVFFDYYFDLNDDTMMRDIMSGVYSGTPDGHNMQTLYPLGAAIALCYRISGSFPWYGGFLFLCQFGCFFLVGVKLCSLVDAPSAQGVGNGMQDAAGGTAHARRRFGCKLLILVGVAVFQWGIWLTHMVNVQYTITCGMLVGTAVFLFLTDRDILSLLLFLLAFQLRSEMALLVLPFLGLAGLFCLWEERPVFTSENLKKYGCLLLFLLAGMGLSLGADALAYGGEWKEFRQIFDDRTTIYDFYPEVVTDDVYEAELESLGVSLADRILLRSYDFGLDERIDTQMLSDIAVYAKERVGAARDWGAIFRESLFRYRYRSFHEDDAPYNLLVMLGYAANIIAIVILYKRDVRKLFGMAAQLFLVVVVRSGLWMFILMRGRDPERITHSLYLVEFCLLAGLFLRYQQQAGGPSVESETKTTTAALRPFASAAFRYLMCAAVTALFVFSATGLMKHVPAVQADQARRQEANRDWEAIDAYCRAHPDTFYFEDVYSTVAFSGKLLERRDNAPANYDIAGGWMCKSPLYRKKLALFGIEEAADALVQGKADFIMSDEEAEQRGLTWIAVPYAEKGLDVYVEEYGRIGGNYGVYQVIPMR